MRTRRPLLAALALPFAVSALAAQERQVLTGANPSIYNLAGEVRVEAGSGPDVTVEVNRAGADARKLEVRLRSGQLSIVYPDDQVVYRAGRNRWGSSNLRVREDGTFGGDWSSGMSGRRVTVRGSGSGLEAWADLVVRVPRGRSVAVHLAVGEVAVTNVDGDLDLDVYSASVRATGTKGKLTVDAGSGSVRVDGATGELSVDTGSGGIEIADVTMTRITLDAGSGSIEGRNVKAERFSADVGSGSVDVEGSIADELLVDTGSGSVRLDLAVVPRSLEIDTGSGGATIRLPATANADLDIETGSGGITSDFAITAETFRRDELRGRIGSGGGRITVSTGSGGVRLVKR